MRWQLQEAKQRLSEPVQRVLDENPQTMTRRGQEVVVVIAMNEFQQLRAKTPDFRDLLLSAPDFEKLQMVRSDEAPRAVDL